MLMALSLLVYTLGQKQLRLNLKNHQISLLNQLRKIFHEFSKQIVGFESAQLRNEEAVKREGLSFEVSSKACTPRHFCLSCVAQSVLQQASCSGRQAVRPWRGSLA